MDRKKPTQESLNAYINSIEKGIMIINDYREHKGRNGDKESVLNVGKLLKEPYLRLNNYNYSFIKTDDIDSCLESVLSDDQRPKAEVDVNKAHDVSKAVETALEEIDRFDKDLRFLRRNLEYHRTGLLTGVHSFKPEEVTLSRVVYRTMECALTDYSEIFREKTENYKKENPLVSSNKDGFNNKMVKVAKSSRDFWDNSSSLEERIEYTKAQKSYYVRKVNPLGYLIPGYRVKLNKQHKINFERSFFDGTYNAKGYDDITESSNVSKKELSEEEKLKQTKMQFANFLDRKGYDTSCDRAISDFCLEQGRKDNYLNYNEMLLIL
ncbi:MAG: hypothetical protein ABIB43_05180 [archaeon]